MSSRTRTTLKQGAPSAPRKRVAVSAVDSLREHESMAALMPALSRIAAIRKDCAALLPDMFGSCAVLRLDSDRLVLSAPNAAMAARLKQKLPMLQASLCEAGWQVSAISLKVQPKETVAKPSRLVKYGLSQQAVDAFAQLERSMEKTPRNEALKSAISVLVRHHVK